MAPNRLAAIGGSLTAVAAAIVAVLGAVDTIEKAIVLSVAVVVVGGLVAVWLRGWQKFEQRGGTR